MNAETQADSAAEDPHVSRPDQDTLYAEFLARAKALPKGTVAGADALVADVVASGLSEATFKRLASAIGMATGLDGDILSRQMKNGRLALDRMQDDDAQRVTTFEDPPPSSAPDPLAVALDQITKIIRHRVVCPNEVAWAVALWIAGAWGVRAPDELSGPDLFPRLFIRSATKRCGKSLLLEIVAYLTPRPLMAENVTAAFSEIEPCRLPGCYCDPLLRDFAVPHAEISFGRPYVATGASSNGGN